MFVNSESNLFSFTIVERSLLDPVGDWFGGGVSLPFGIAVQEHKYSFFRQDLLTLYHFTLYVVVVCQLV